MAGTDSKENLKEEGALGRSVKGRRQKAPSRRQQLAAQVLKGRVSAEEPEGTTRLNAEVPSSLHRRFKEKCEQEGRSMSEALRELVEAYLSV